MSMLIGRLQKKTRISIKTIKCHVTKIVVWPSNIFNYDITLPAFKIFDNRNILFTDIIKIFAAI